MTKSLLIAVTLCLAFQDALAQNTPFGADADIQSSYIEGNVPVGVDFYRFLQRDLVAYFRGITNGKVTGVEWELLRDRPTQSGVAYPKYYLWARALGADGSRLQEGAVRVAAVERTHFEVTDFLSWTDIQQSPGRVGGVFPSLLVPAILSKSAVATDGSQIPGPEAAPALLPYAIPATFAVPHLATCAAPLASVVAVPPSRPCSLAAIAALPTLSSAPPPVVRIDPTRRRFEPAMVQGLLRMGLCAATRGSC